MSLPPFDRAAHLYTSASFAAIIQDALRFFNQTPTHQLPLPEKFQGTGVYALYCVAQQGVYAPYHPQNHPTCQLPIYVGKAVPLDWRQARSARQSSQDSYELHRRLNQHVRNIRQGAGLALADFFCRFMILEGDESDLIGTLEAALIRTYNPLWNTVVDGFGNHDPGKGRYNQAKSDWDVYHPGRAWAEKCQGKPASYEAVHGRVTAYLASLKPDS